MKKALCILLSALIVFSALPLLSSASDASLSFLVAADLHYAQTPDEVTVKYPNEKYYCAYDVGTLPSESNAIIRQFLREASDSDARFLLLCGDLTENGTMEQHRDMAAMLAEFERSTGKRVFVIDGNHDFHGGISAQDFKTVYAPVSYDEALAVDPDSCSYTAELDDRYRLLAFDTCRYGYGEDGVTEERLAWAREQAEIAEKDGKTLIVIMHHSFLEHIQSMSLLLPAFIIRSSVNMKEHLLNWGVRYAFSGHFHGQDIASYTDAANRTIYDIMTTSLCAYPCGYRTCKLTEEGLQIDSKYIQGVDAADLPQSGYTDELLGELTGDLNTFADGCFRVAFDLKKERFFGKDYMGNVFARIGGEPLKNLVDTCYPKFYENLNLPIYQKDAGDGESLQAIGEKLGLQFRTTESKTVWDCLYYFVKVMYCGDENVPYDDDEIVLFMQCVYSALYDAMRSVNTDLRKELLADIHGQFKQAALPFAVTGAARVALGAVGDERLLETVLLMMAPIIEMFSVDDDTPDGSAFLPAKSDELPFIVLFRQTMNQIIRFVRRFILGVFAIYFPKQLRLV